MTITLELEDQTAREIYEALEREFAGARTPVDVCKVPGQGDWHQAMVEKLGQEIEPYRGAIALLDLAASRPGEEIRYSDVVRVSGLSDRQIRSDLGAMSKITRIAFDKKMWPLRAWQAGDGEMRYQMPHKTARWWVER